MQTSFYSVQVQGGRQAATSTTPMPIVESHLVAAYMIVATGGLTPLMLGPGRQDAYTIAGAMAAVLFVIIQLQGTSRGQKKYAKASLVILAGMFCGAVLPGFIIKMWFVDMIHRFDWEHYAVFGFVGALSGQRIIAWLVEFIDDKFPRFLDRVASTFLGIKPPKDDG